MPKVGEPLAAEAAGIMVVVVLVAATGVVTQAPREVVLTSPVLSLAWVVLDEAALMVVGTCLVVAGGVEVVATVAVLILTPIFLEDCGICWLLLLSIPLVSTPI